MQFLGLPRFQYTTRELSTGAQFLAYADDLSKTYAVLTVKRLLKHLEKHGVDLTEVVIQSDNGPEFDGGRLNQKSEGFVSAIEKDFPSRHVYIPPGCSNANADVESVHATIETEFFDIALIYFDEFGFDQDLWLIHVQRSDEFVEAAQVFQSIGDSQSSRTSIVGDS
jgi:hypothetical protein